MFAFSLVSYNGTLCLLWVEFGPFTIKWPVFGHLGLLGLGNMSALSPLLGSQGRMLSLCSPRRFHWEAGPAIKSVVCLQPIARVAVELVYVVFFPSPWVRDPLK